MTTEKKPIQVKSPFKLLDPYLEKDHHVFFGRETEEEKIFEHIKRNKILLLYGPSGAGKTSLIQCGLAHRLKASGWTPVLVRRNENINTSLVNAVEEALLLLIKSIPSEEQMDTGIDSINKQDLIEKISVLYAFYRRPVHLIFDQFEEFLIMATANERETFLTILKSLFAILSGVSIIIVLREEYFGYFDRFQEALPGLAEKRIWIDPMSTTKIKKVISELLSVFEISLQDPEKNIDQIIDALKNKKGEVSLAHLQIYLDQFWRADYNRDYPNGHEGDAWPPLTFTTTEIKEFGSIENVLQRFLSERKTILLDMIKSKFPGTDDAFLTKVLDEFVTEFGTKQPVNFEVPDGLHYFFKGKTVEQLNKFDKPTLHYTIGLLQENGILRIKGRRMELTHDSLAKLIHDQRDARKKKQIRIRQRLKIHIEDKRQLTIEDVNDWNSYMDSIFFSPAELKYFHDSKRKREEEIFFQKVKTRRNKIAFIVLSAFSVIAILAVLLYKNQSQNWELRKSGYALAYLSKLDTMQNPTEALTIAQYIYSYMDGDSLKQGAVREKMNILMRKESFQNMFAYFKHPISIDSSGEIDFAEFSTSGEFAIVGIKNTYMSQQSGYVVVYGKNSTDTLRNCNSVFFLRNKDKIILTYNDNRTFCLYDCATKKRHDTINLSFASKSSQILTYPDAWLDSPNTLIFSIADTIDNNRSEKYRLVSYDLSAKKPITIFPRQSLNGLSCNGQLVTLTRDSKSVYTTDIYDNRGKLVNSIFWNSTGGVTPRIYFTDNNNLYSCHDSSFILSTDSGKSVKSIKTEAKMHSADWDGKGDYALLQVTSPSSTSRILDLTTGKLLPFKEWILHLNSEKRLFTTQGKEDQFANTLYLRNFVGDTVKSFTSPQGILGATYENINHLMVFGGTSKVVKLQDIYLLNDSLKTVFMLTRALRDRLFWAGNAPVLGLIRNDQLSVYKLSDSTLRRYAEITDNNASQKKSFTTTQQQAETKTLLRKYSFKFPDFFD